MPAIGALPVVEARQPPACKLSGYAGNPFGGSGFFEYYQISRDDEDNSAEEFEPEVERESRGYTEGLHSPFGMIYSLATQTGYKVNYILWNVNYPTLVMMTADAPHYVSGKRKQVIRVTSKEESDKLFAKMYG